MTNPLTLIEEWSDDDVNDGEWPYPTHYIMSSVSGELAERICKAVEVEGSVILIERTESAGYSTYTFWNEDYIVVRINDKEVKNFEGGFSEFMRWLDEKVPAS